MYPTLKASPTAIKHLIKNSWLRNKSQGLTLPARRSLLPACQSSVPESPHLSSEGQTAHSKPQSPPAQPPRKLCGGQCVFLLPPTNTRQNGLDPHHPNNLLPLQVSSQKCLWLLKNQNCEHRWQFFCHFDVGPHAKSLQGGPKTLFPGLTPCMVTTSSQHRQNLWLFSKQLSMAAAKEFGRCYRLSQVKRWEIILWGLGCHESSSKTNQAFHKPKTSLLAGWRKQPHWRSLWGGISGPPGPGGLQQQSAKSWGPQS